MTDFLLMPLVAGVSARDCSASPSVSMSYEEDPPVANSLDWLVNERDESVLLVPVLADKKAELLIGEDDVIGDSVLLCEGDLIVKEEDAVARSATVSDDRAGGIMVRMILFL